MRFTKKQINFALISISLAVISWCGLEISSFIDSLFWTFSLNQVSNDEWILLISSIGKNIMFPGILTFSILYSIKLNINIIKYSVFYMIGFLVSYFIFQFTSNSGTDRLWASGSGVVWKAGAFTQAFQDSENFFIELCTFMPLIFYIAICGICIIEYLTTKKNNIEQENNFNKQYLSFGVLYLILLSSLLFRIIGIHYRIISPSIEKLIWFDNLVIFMSVVFQISLILLAYITYIKKIPIWIFGVSCVSFFLVNHLTLSLISTISIFNPTLNAIISSAFIFFAIKSQKKYLIIISIVSFIFIILIHIWNNSPTIKGLIYITFRYNFEIPKNYAYSIWFLIPNTIAFYIYNNKHIEKNKNI